MHIFKTNDTVKIDRSKLSRLMPWNVAIGLTISLLLHVVLVLWSWNMNLAPVQGSRSQSRPLEVRLIRELPPPPPLPAPVPVSIPIASKTTLRPVQKPRELSIVQSTLPIANASPVAPTIAPSEPQIASGKHLDLNALRANLSTVVAEVDREKRDTPVGQLEGKPLYPRNDESKIGKAIDNTTRPDCKDKYANAGLLRPLLMLTTLADKKDSGCKW